MLLKPNKLYIFVVAYLVSVYLYAQSDRFNFTNITSKEGLSFNNVTKIIKDQHGLMWIGTRDGLNRYDGYNFKIFSPQKDDSTSIISRYTTDILEDNNGFIWVATPEGLSKYNWHTETFKNYLKDNRGNSYLTNDYILSLFMDSKGDIWIGTLDGLNKYIPSTDSFIHYTLVSNFRNPDSTNSIMDIEEDLDGNLWLSTWDGLTQFSREGKVLNTFFYNDTTKSDFDYRIISALKYDSINNVLWVGTSYKGLVKFNVDTKKYIFYNHSETDPNTISENRITCIEIDLLDRLWIGTFTGLNVFDPRKETFKRIYTNHNISQTINSNQINDIFIDNTGMNWISTTNGISKYFLPKNNFKFYQYTTENDIYGLSHESPIDLFIDDEDNLWIGTLNGLNMIDNRTKKVTKYYHDPNNSNSVCGNFIRSIYKDSKGIIWIGTNYKGLNSFNPKTNKWSVYKFAINQDNTISNNGIISITEDSQGNMWFGTWWGLNMFDRKTKIFKRYIADEYNNNTIPNSVVWDVIEDSHKNIWVATDNGVSMLDVSKDKFTHFTSNDSLHFINSNKAFKVFESKDSLIWFSTPNGLNEYNPKTGKTLVYEKKDGLPDNNVLGIVEDDDNNLWFPTNKGLVKFIRNQKVFNIYTERDGLRDNTFIQNISSRTSDGKLYFGSQGILCIDPLKFVENNQLAKVVFTDFKIANRSVEISYDGILNNSIFGTNHIVVPPGNGMLTFEFALLDFYDNNITYRYKLNGFDKDWNYIGKRNSVTYTNLLPGNYMLTVMATTNNNNKREVAKSIELTIKPHLYQTLVFRILLVLVIIALILLYIKYKTRLIERQKRKLEVRVEERTKDLAQKTDDLNKTVHELNQEIATKDKFFSIIAHDLRGPFMGLLGFAKHLVDDLDSLSKEDIKFISSSILRQTTLTFGLLQNLLQWARIQTGKIDYNPVEIGIKELFYNVKELFSITASKKNISFIVDINTKKTAIADSNMIEVVLRNLISNSIKFTENGGTITLKATESKDSITISVIDTGVGIPKKSLDVLFSVESNITTLGTDNEQGSGLGLILCKEFIEYNNGNISVKSELGQGTDISFTLPKKS